MKLASITAGAAGMYCGSCMRDNTLAAALIDLGHECLLVPTYTPIRTDEPDVSVHRVFLGGISIYLEQKSSLYRRLPFLDRFLSARWLLRLVSRFAIKTDAHDLGELTVSMLQGTHGHQAREVRRLVDWLAEERPDAILLTNALLSGVVPEFKARLKAPIFCTLQGDDIFLEYLPASLRAQAIGLIQENCRPADGYVVTCRAYADFMAAYLGLPRERMHVVYPGIDNAGFGPAAQKNTGDHLVLGYLARICPEKGLHLLVEAFKRLRRRTDLPPLKLRVAGYLGARDRQYLDDLRRKVEADGWLDRFDHVGELDHAGKVAFLQTLDLFSVPTTYREPKGLYVLEAMASGVPVVQPDHGSFPELLAHGGGVMVKPDDAGDLARGLAELLQSEDRRLALGAAGREAVERHFTARRMAEDVLRLIRSQGSA